MSDEGVSSSDAMLPNMLMLIPSMPFSLKNFCTTSVSGFISISRCPLTFGDTALCAMIGAVDTNSLAMRLSPPLTAALAAPSTHDAGSSLRVMKNSSAH